MEVSSRPRKGTDHVGYLSVDDLQEPKAQVARAAHTLSVCKRHLAHKLLSLQQSILFTTTIDLRLMGISPDEDLASYVHVAHGLEVSSQINSTLWK
jgi:hypothetical protein